MPAEPSDAFAVREASAADAAAIAALESESMPQPWSEALVVDELANQRSLALVAREVVVIAEGELGGYALFRRLVDEVELLRVAVRPVQRRHGLARRLVDHGLARLRAEHGCTAALLEVRADNASAIAFYERTNWVLVGRRRRYYPDGADALLYQRQL